MGKYTFYKDGQELQADNLTAFCREHGLQRRHMAEVVEGRRRSHHGWSVEDPNGMTVEAVLQMAEVAARSSEDAEYSSMVLERVARIRNGEPLEVVLDPDLVAKIHQH